MRDYWGADFLDIEAGDQLESVQGKFEQPCSLLPHCVQKHFWPEEVRKVELCL